MTSEQLAVQLKDYEDRIKVTEKGVANFQAFRLDTTRKIGFVYGATWFAGIVSAVFLIVLAWAFTLVLPAAKVIMDDYYHSHPAAKAQQQVIAEPLHEPYAARNITPQNASGNEGDSPWQLNH
jgi:hypothetical protein